MPGAHPESGAGGLIGSGGTAYPPMWLDGVGIPRGLDWGLASQCAGWMPRGPYGSNAAKKRRTGGEWECERKDFIHMRLYVIARV